MSGGGATARPLRALLVDDSDASLAGLARILGGAPGLELVGTARDGEQALSQALSLQPDVVLLDLHMPRMDGFTFLRLLMARRPTPVIVVSAWSSKADVFKSLELGAIEFVAKPEGEGGLAAFRDELLEKCAIVRALRIENVDPHPVPALTPAPVRAMIEPARVAVIGASTGGPQALAHVLAALPGDLPLGILLAQHMPERFTRAFAERLGRGTRFAVKEAEEGDLVVEGRVLVAPGGHHLEVAGGGADGALRASVAPRGRDGRTRYCPSVDRLFTSAARALGARVCAVVLTGMGSDGRAGVAAVKAAGGLVLAESGRTAVVDGMPRSAAATGAVDEVLDLAHVAARLAEFARGEQVRPPGG
ncbi:MAG TPA: chemotaxis-specific protein-glutamate methyltransferase CheB [Anaeromyxobacteraceae bacterium]|nr:chemotaxis-specific protein-glutamate methyltransferase CheB [Anaeromyxobacteraceae bacterium]